MGPWSRFSMVKNTGFKTMESHKWVMATFDKSTDYTEMDDSSVFSLNFYLGKRESCIDLHISF